MTLPRASFMLHNASTASSQCFVFSNSTSDPAILHFCGVFDEFRLDTLFPILLDIFSGRKKRAPAHVGCSEPFTTKREHREEQGLNDREDDGIQESYAAHMWQAPWSLTFAKRGKWRSRCLRRVFPQALTSGVTHARCAQLRGCLVDEWSPGLGFAPGRPAQVSASSNGRAASKLIHHSRNTMITSSFTRVNIKGCTCYQCHI